VDELWGASAQEYSDHVEAERIEMWLSVGEVRDRVGEEFTLPSNGSSRVRGETSHAPQ
jgi:hypothetical protein